MVPMSHHRIPAIDGYSPTRRAFSNLAATITAALMILSGGLFTGTPAQAAPSDIVSVSSSTWAADAQKLLNLINQHRASKGLAPVKYSKSLSGIAQSQSDRLVKEEVIDHSNLFLTDRRAAGYNAAGEIHALSWQNSVPDLMNWWKGSHAHNKVLTDPRMQVVGIGLTYVDGRLSGTGEGWRLVGTVDSYGYPAGSGPSDVTRTVTAAAPRPQADTVAPVAAKRVAPPAYTVKGGIKSRYQALGGAAKFGYPTMNERGGLVNGGVYQNFRAAGGAQYKFMWSPSSGAHVIKETGAIGKRWKAAGFERGWGYPVTEEYRVGSEMRQRFSKGYTVHWSSVTGKTWVTR